MSVQMVHNVGPVASSEATTFAGHQGMAGGVAALFEQANLTQDLEAVERLLLERTRSRAEVIRAASSHTIRSGGKRLRAALALLAARLGHYRLERVIHAAAAVELIQAASLVHDDLVDQAVRRRGRVTVHARWDNDVALMVGDYFFALAADEMARSPDPRIITFYAQAVRTVVEGELSPVTMLEPTKQALEQYYYKTGAKTAALFEAACKAGMAAGGGNDAQIAALGRYGFDLGMAFQIIDDMLDFTGDEATLGKPAGNDLRQGTITLPLILAMERAPSAPLRAIIEHGTPNDSQVQAVIQEVIAAGGVLAASAEAQRFIGEAIGHLKPFPPSPALSALVRLANFVVERDA
ncbi:polyprenyl synthetase family protein [Candidatus Viridilinea mediisalina]|uniref:Polyprenyl synthetase n=1 Tax=Candidatus Viridilinea mediisalina TaxID=2024553 RepID=A0A2A6RGA4_9CHLR|nr:polyprenyl synthetase family protein [Candidatus Viridilinea mediisalina]PDW02052.1 polyprenyl synthetase [Candidatus Viridilinea mediisalina]